MSVGSVCALVAGTVAFAAPVSSSAVPARRAAQTFSVMDGHDIPAGGRHRPADYMNFVPNTISVHKGDHITFEGEFHTATALPTSVTNPNTWIRTHARRLGQRYFFLARDDEPGRIIFNPNVIYPTTGCKPTACAVDGSTIVNSGALGVVAPTKSTFTINVAAGKSFWVICLIHPQMRMLVNVVPNGKNVQSQAQIDAAAKQLIAAQTTRATALWQRLQHQHSHMGANGRRVVDAWSGYDVKRLELLGMFPHTIHVRRGQTVEWHFDKLLYEPHSVVFPARLAQVISNGPPPKCEKNNGSGDVPVTKKFTCPPGSRGPIEIEVGGRIFKKSGTHVVTRATGRHNSGARGGFDISRSGPYFLRFPVANAKGYHYACGVHGRMMSGIVVVR